jgi:hypothetical protein
MSDLMNSNNPYEKVLEYKKNFIWF